MNLPLHTLCPAITLLFVTALLSQELDPASALPDSLLPAAVGATPDTASQKGDADSINNGAASASSPDMERPSQTVTPAERATIQTVQKPRMTTPVTDTLAGNLPRVIEAKNGPLLVTADIYVPSGKTVTIKPGTILLFRNFTEMHVEGRLIAEGTASAPILFTSEYDQTCNPASTLLPNPYDWNGIFIHEGGLGSSLTYCTVRYTVYGVNSLSRYIKLDHVTFSENGRADLTIEGTRHAVTKEPYSYALTISDAKKDGVPVAILMDPQAKKRNLLRYGGFSLAAGGLTMGIWSLILLDHDQNQVDAMSKKTVIDQNSPLIAKTAADWDKAVSVRNRDRWMAGASFLLAAAGSCGVLWSFRF